RGWRIVVLEEGPFWDPDTDWVSDEAGSHDLFWTAPRVIGGEDPVELGKNNSGRGVGGSMTHFAGYTPRLHPSDFETHPRDGLAAHHARPRRDRAQRRDPRRLHGGADRDRRGGPLHRGHVLPRGSRAPPARRGRRRRRVLDRDPAAAAELGERPVPRRARQRR